MFEILVHTKPAFSDLLCKFSKMLRHRELESQTIYMSKDVFLELGGYDGVQKLLLLNFELACRIWSEQYDIVFHKPENELGLFCQFNLVCNPELHPATYDFDIKILPDFDIRSNSVAFISLFNHLKNAVLNYEPEEDDVLFPLETKMLFDFTAKVQKAISETLQLNRCNEDLTLGGAEFKNNYISLVVWDRRAFEDESTMYRFCLFPEEFYLRDISDSILYHEKKI